jgi:hypothetical protein
VVFISLHPHQKIQIQNTARGFFVENGFAIFRGGFHFSALS